MSIETFQRILTRAASDAAFADLLFADPDRALDGCDLTPEEALSLKMMSRSDLGQYAFRPQPRPQSTIQEAGRKKQDSRKGKPRKDGDIIHGSNPLGGKNRRTTLNQKRRKQ